MPIDKISFKNNNNFEQFKPVSNSPQVLKPVQQQKNDTFGISDKQKDLITYSSIVAGILLLIGLIKRKLITEFFSKLLKKREIPEITKTKPVEPSKQKNLETPMPEQSLIPKPNFTCGEENPAQFAKEKFEYIQKVMNRMDENEASALEGLDMFEKYGIRVRYGKYNERETLSDLALAVSCTKPAPTDKVLKRFVEVYNDKIKIKDEVESFRASSNLRYILDNHAREMTKDTALMYVDAMKRTSFDKNDWYTANTELVENIYNHFTKEEVEEMTPHVEKLGELLKDCKYIN